MRKQEYINLHLGAGKRNIPGFINVDLSNYKHIHFKRNVSNLKNFKTNSVDYIYASHVLEYFDYNEAYKVLKEWKRVLKPNGILRISIPDFNSLLKVYRKTKNIDKIIGPLYGKTKQKKNTIYHKCVYDHAKIKKILKNVGFKNIKKFDWKKIWHSNYDDHSKAYFPHMNKKGILISLNISAKK